MLELIAKYAMDEGLTARPGFTVKTIKWLIELNREGEFVGVQELGNASNTKNSGLQFRDCPEFPGNEMLSGGKAHPVAESLNVVALMGKTIEEPATPKDELKHAYYVDLLEELGVTFKEATLCVEALRSEQTVSRIRSELHAARAKITDKATFAIDGNPLVEDPKVAEWWSLRRQQSGLFAQEGTSRCLVTGSLTTPLATHPKISGLGSVGGLAIGSSLISFDKGAFASFGLEQSANAVVSEEAAMQYRAGLNHIISHGKKLGPMIVGHWFSGSIDADRDPFPWLVEGDDDQEDKKNSRSRMQELLSAIQAGRHPDLANFRYYLLTLSGAAGRVMLRDWQEGQFVDLVFAVNQWFADLSITASDGLSVVRGPKFIAVAATAVRELDNLEAPMLAGLWRSAFTNSQIPLSAIRGALNRTRIDILENQTRPVRLALLKAYIIRNTDHGDFMHPYLNPDHPRTAYQAGRLMAVLANIQYAALGDVNANIVQRFYPAASSTPALVFGRLTRQSQFHLNKIDSGLARHLEEKLAAIWGRIQSDLPTTFSLEEQTLFALGYYQQLAQDVQERNTAAAAKKARTEPGDKS
jgi:CRISPR-associated protein Csd1